MVLILVQELRRDQDVSEMLDEFRVLCSSQLRVDSTLRLVSLPLLRCTLVGVPTEHASLACDILPSLGTIIRSCLGTRVCKRARKVWLERGANDFKGGVSDLEGVKNRSGLLSAVPAPATISKGSLSGLLMN